MEISDEKLRQIVRETLRELGSDADPALIRKVVHEVVRQLNQSGATTSTRRLAIVKSSESMPSPRREEKSDGTSTPGY